jgi:hypothetical protein
MKIDQISKELKDNIKSFNRDTLAMNPYEIACFLSRCGEILLKYVEYTNKQLDTTSEEYINGEDITKIDNLFREMGDNFFPMAHTTEPLRNLKIVNDHEYEDLKNHIENYLITVVNYCNHNLATSIETNERVITQNEELLGELRIIKEKVREVLNP